MQYSHKCNTVNAIGQRVQVQGVTDDRDQLRENECMLVMQVTYFMLTSDTISHLFLGETMIPA